MADAPESIASETAHAGRLFDLRLETLRWADGRESRREMIEHPGAVCMIAVDGDGRLLLVEQYRHGARANLLEIPAGTLEAGEDPAAAAVRELREEVGMAPGRVQALGGFWVAPSYATEYLHLFLCAELTAAPLPGDEDEDIAVVRLTRAEALAAVDEGRIADAKSIAGILRWDRLRGR